MAKKHAVRSDARLNPALREDLQGVRSLLHEAAEQQPLPLRFTTENDPNRPAVIITDKTTGRQTTVPLFAYLEVRAALTELFAPL